MNGGSAVFLLAEKRNSKIEVVSVICGAAFFRALGIFQLLGNLSGEGIS